MSAHHRGSPAAPSPKNHLLPEERRPTTPLPSWGTARKVAAVPRNVDLFRDRKDITQSLQALVEKYSFTQITIATADGLVFASSSGSNALNDAAVYSDLFHKNWKPVGSGITLLGLSYKGSDLVCIIRSGDEIPEEWHMGIQNDTQDILHRWI